MVKTCTRCGREKLLGLFKIDRTRPDGRSSWCKACHSASASCGVNREKANRNNARYKKTAGGRAVNKRYKQGRRVAHRNGRPAWRKQMVIDAIYAEAKAAGFYVDHIVPLRSEIVCGLHVENNLQLMTGQANRQKGNRVWHDMPHFELTED